MYHTFRDVINKLQTQPHYSEYWMTVKNQPKDIFLKSSQFVVDRKQPHLQTVTSLQAVVILWGIVLFQAFTHTFVAPSVTVLWSSVEITQQVEAFGVFGITSSAAIEQVQTEELAMVLGCSLENNCGSQHAVDWPVFKLVEAGVYLLGKKIQIHDQDQGYILCENFAALFLCAPFITRSVNM